MDSQFRDRRAVANQGPEEAVARAPRHRPERAVRPAAEVVHPAAEAAHPEAEAKRPRHPVASGGTYGA